MCVLFYIRMKSAVLFDIKKYHLHHLSGNAVITAVMFNHISTTYQFVSLRRPTFCLLSRFLDCCRSHDSSLCHSKFLIPNHLRSFSSLFCQVLQRLVVSPRRLFRRLKHTPSRTASTMTTRQLMLGRTTSNHAGKTFVGVCLPITERAYFECFQKMHTIILTSFQRTVINRCKVTLN